MAMNVGLDSSSDGDVMVEMNTTPLIDVLLVLLIMLIITIPVQTHAVVLNMAAGTPPPMQPVVVTIDVDFDGTLSWNGETTDRAGLDARLTAVAAQPVQPEIHLKPNRLVTYRHVAGVMASVQHHGLTKLAVIGNRDGGE
jgi:biopolymer transport protein ExbD